MQSGLFQRRGLVHGLGAVGVLVVALAQGLLAALHAGDHACDAHARHGNVPRDHGPIEAAWHDHGPRAEAEASNHDHPCPVHGDEPDGPSSPDHEGSCGTCLALVMLAKGASRPAPAVALGVVGSFGVIAPVVERTPALPTPREMRARPPPARGPVAFRLA